MIHHAFCPGEHIMPQRNKPKPETRNPKILVIDDERDILRSLELALTKEGYQVRCAPGGAEAIEIFQSESFGLVVTDIRMPKMDGLEVMRRIKDMDEDVEFIVMTGFATVDNVIQSLKDGMAFDYLTKPLETIHHLFISVQRAFEKRRMRIQNRDLIHELKIAKDTLEERIEQRTRELKTANLELSAVNAISTTANQSLDKKALSGKAVKKISEVLRIPDCAIILFDETKKSGVIEAGYDALNASIHEVGESIVLKHHPGIQEAIESREAVVIEDALLDTRTRGIKGIVSRFNIKSIVFAPLIHRKQILGVLALGRREKDSHFREREIRLITTVAGHLTVALVNSGLFEQTERQLAILDKLNNNLEERVKERTAQLSHANEKLREEIVEHKQAEDAFRESQQILRSVFDGITEPLILLGPGLSVRGLNQAARKYFHKETFHEGLHKPCYEVFFGRSSPCEGCKISLHDNMTGNITFERKSITGNSREEQIDVYYLNENGVQGAIIRIHDITEKNKIRNQLIRTDRLTSLGQLSSGIAHEIRNPLASMRLFLDILCDESKFEHTDQEKEILIELSQNIGRVDEIIKRVLDFARPPVISSNTFGVNTLICRTVKMWSDKLRKSGIKQELHLEDALPPVKGDEVGLEQVISNLVLNAVEAMDKGGVLKIATAKKISRRNHGREVVTMEVKDNGPGIRSGDTENIFNPFFTTKPSGTGLGLAISHQIIEHHGGTIYVESDPGEGTVFAVELPLE